MIKPLALTTLVAVGIFVTARAVRPPLAAAIPWSRAVYDQDDQLLRLRLTDDDKYRVFTPLGQFPKAFVDAMLFKEDRYFRRHPGVNPASLVRAFRQTYLRDGRRIGGSTISMQLARLKYHLKSKTVLGKLNQIAHTLWIEAMYGKDEILEAYLNLLPYGSNVEGAGTASLIYFGKAAARLNFPEALTLAVIPQSPRLRAVGPRGEIRVGPRLRRARDELFNLWSADHAVTESDRLSLEVPLHMRGTRDLPFLAPHFTDDLWPEYASSPTVRTTLKRRTQSLLERRLGDYVRRQNSAGVHNAAALLIDWTTMQVKASVGSVNFFDDQIQGQVNGTRAQRSPGSTLKPFAYALAFDQGKIHPQSILKDAPSTFAGFDPENFDRDFQGPITAEQALVRSRNVPAVQIAAQLERPTFFEFLQSVGIRNLQPAEHYGLSPILGGLEVTMEDLVRLYAMLANQGELRDLKKISDGQAPRLLGRPVTAEASAMVLDILKRLPRPPAHGGSPWSREVLDVYWKTGTSQAFRDAWTIGIFSHYVLAVWLGNFDGSSNPAFVGRDLAAPLFFEIVEALGASERLDQARLVAPDVNLKAVKVCAVSGQLPGPHCHHLKTTLFIPGRSPIATCDVHREIKISRDTGLRLCDALAIEGKSSVYEFWPSDLLKLFAKAGLPRAAPPPWDPRCRIQDLATSGVPPRILSPKMDLVYSMRSGGEDAHQISLRAAADADVRETFWFIDEAFVGKARPRDNLFWTLKPGRHAVRVVDDQGRSDARSLQVQVVE